MGEYAKRLSDGQTIKIGTCETMFGLRFEDRHKVLHESLESLDIPGLFFRIPFPDEDQVQIGEYEDWQRGISLFKRVPSPRYTEDCHDFNLIAFAPDDLQPGRLQLRHGIGYLVSAPCYHGIDLPKDTDEIKFGWNCKDPFCLELTSVKYTKEGLKPVFRCRHCDRMWSCAWDEILDFVPDEALKRRLIDYSK